jgi:hypothetical protein
MAGGMGKCELDPEQVTGFSGGKFINFASFHGENEIVLVIFCRAVNHGQQLRKLVLQTDHRYNRRKPDQVYSYSMFQGMPRCATMQLLYL